MTPQAIVLLRWILLLLSLGSLTMGAPVVNHPELRAACTGDFLALSRSIAQLCCQYFDMHCLRTSSVLETDDPVALKFVGETPKKVRLRLPESAIRPKTLKLGRLGEECDGVSRLCRPPLSCRDGLCRRRAAVPPGEARTNGPGNARSEEMFSYSKPRPERLLDDAVTKELGRRKAPSMVSGASRPNYADLLRLGQACGDGYGACRPSLSCIGGLCRKRARPQNGASTGGGANGPRFEGSGGSQRSPGSYVAPDLATAEKIEAIKRRLNTRDASLPVEDDTPSRGSSDEGIATEEDVAVQGFSVSGLEEIPALGRKVKLDSQKEFYNETQLAKAVLAEGFQGNETCKEELTLESTVGTGEDGMSEDQPGKSSPKTVAVTRAKLPLGDGSSAPREGQKKWASMPEVLENMHSEKGAMAETEDEQIADSIALALERDGAAVVDEHLLSVLDNAVTRAMDKYEAIALVEGGLKIDVDNLAKGKSSKIQVEVPPKQAPPKHYDGPTLGPEDRAKLLNERVFSALRARLERGVSKTLLDAAAIALITPGCGISGGAVPPPLGRDDTKDSRLPKVPCEVVRWLRANWFETGMAAPQQRDVGGAAPRVGDEL